ncbi:MAG: IS1634 family transposase [Firmicutes bacterium]|nr:IS1634 family transposase [Bacillota bacterium]
MYIRTTKTKTKNGIAKYVQLAHNQRDPKTGVPKAVVLYNFGRIDQLDLDALRRLVKSVSRFLEPQEAMAIREQLGEESPFEFLGSRQIGGSWLLDGMWERLGIEKTLQQLLSERDFRTPIESLLLAMVANRALAPASKLHLEHWVAKETLIDELPEVDVHQLYRAMDFLIESADEIQERVFFSVASLLNLEVDVLFLDTTTTYFEIEGEDEDHEDQKALRKWGYGKDNHPELAQVVIAFAVTRDGIPVRCWVWPGNTADENIVEQVKKDLNGWKLGRVLMVEDTGFNSEDNRRILQGAGGHYLIGEKMRLGSQGKPHEAFSRKGKYQKLDNGLEIKEVIIGGDSEARRRFVMVRNPEEAKRDSQKRQEIVKEVERRLEELRQLAGEPHKKAACALRSHQVYGRYLRQTRTGKLVLNHAKIRSEEHLAGKYLVSTSDDQLSAKDVVLGYKQLAVIERVFKDLKHLVDIRPVYHRLADRIRAHVLLCWLAMLLIRVAENETEQTWHEMKKALSTLHVGGHRTHSGEVWQTNPVDEGQKKLFETLKLKPPPRYYSISTPARGTM